MVVDTAVHVGGVDLVHPVMTAAGTSGHGAELADFGPLDSLGAVVVKSLSAFPWSGNPSPRLYPMSNGMMNAVGLQGPGVEEWATRHLQELARCGARVVVSVWGRSPDEYEQVSDLLAHLLVESPSAQCVVAVEVNLSCPNLAGHGIIAHDARVSAEVIGRCRDVGRPIWAKLSPNTDRLVDVARSVTDAGAQAVTLVNTVAGLVIDEHSGRSVLGNGSSGGLSGRIIHPIAVKAVNDVHSAHPDIEIIGVGGVTTGWEAVEMMLVGARAVQVGTATFADPRAPFRVASELVEWADKRGIESLSDLSGLSHRGGFLDPSS